jgi:hypothetical protein
LRALLPVQVPPALEGQLVHGPSTPVHSTGALARSFAIMPGRCCST